MRAALLVRDIMERLIRYAPEFDLVVRGPKLPRKATEERLRLIGRLIGFTPARRTDGRRGHHRPIREAFFEDAPPGVAPTRAGGRHAETEDPGARDEPIVGRRLRPSRNRVTRSTSSKPADDTPVDEKPVDIVVTDIRMEGVDGMGVLRHAQSLPVRPLVIMITGYATIDAAREALTIGAFDFIAKPFKLDDLRAVIARAAERVLALRVI
jgi:CheY-like chemotaxis protein